MKLAMRKPYQERTDLEKIRAQWVKLTGLRHRTDWSAAVVRAATATEIAVNFAYRQELVSRNQYDKVTADEKLIRANGLNGKLDKLLLPLLKGDDKHKTVKSLRKLAGDIYQKRNSIVHSGHFCGKAEAVRLINNCQEFVHGIVRLYDQAFTLPLKPTPRTANVPPERKPAEPPAL
jgi:hypothetical protein